MVSTESVGYITCGEENSETITMKGIREGL